jgi:hypothetical protein
LLYCSTNQLWCEVSCLNLHSSSGDSLNTARPVYSCSLILEKVSLLIYEPSNRLVFVGKIAENEHLLSVWKVENNVDLTHVKDVAIGKYFPSKYEEPLQVDEHFIALHTPFGDDDVTINLISLKTFQVERSLSCLYFGSYDGGYVFLMNSDHSSIRMLDVASGALLHDMPMKLSYFDVYLTRGDYNYVVTDTTNRPDRIVTDCMISARFLEGHKYATQ